MRYPRKGAIVERMKGFPEEIVAALTGRGFRHVYVDGGLTIQPFLRARLTQRLTITRVPVISGSGIPLFGPTRRNVLLKHVKTQQYSSGLVKSK